MNSNFIFLPFRDGGWINELFIVNLNFIHLFPQDEEWINKLCIVKLNFIYSPPLRREMNKMNYALWIYILFTSFSLGRKVNKSIIIMNWIFTPPLSEVRGE